MKKELSAVLLLVISLFCCACASKSADSIAGENLVTAAAAGNHLYSMDRSADPAEEMPDLGTFAQEPLTYVVFAQYSNSFSAEDGTKLFVSRSNIPQIVTEDPAVNDWLASVVSETAEETQLQVRSVAQWAEEDYQNRAGDEQLPFYAYSYYTDVSIERLDNAVISGLQVDSVNSGGAHPNYVQKACNLDLIKQNQLTLAEVIVPERVSALRQLVLERLEKQFGGLEASGLYADYPDIVASYFSDADLTPYWYFSENGLVIYFNCYDIAPYAAGIIKVELLYGELKGTLQPEYFPQSRQDGEGSAALIPSGEGRNVLVVPTDGDCFYIGFIGNLYDVRIRSLTGWITERIPITGSMLMAANRLTGVDAVALPLDSTYLLTYTDGAGYAHNLEINANGIREIVSEIAE